MTVPAWVKPGLWGLVVGAVAWWAVLAWGFGWMSAGAAAQLASDKTDTALVAAMEPYCVARFEQQANAVDSWKALKKSAADYSQTDFIKKGGWVELPKQQLDPEVTGQVADQGAMQLLALKSLDGVQLSSLNVKQ